MRNLSFSICLYRLFPIVLGFDLARLQVPGRGSLGLFSGSYPSLKFAADSWCLTLNQDLPPFEFERGDLYSLNCTISRS